MKAGTDIVKVIFVDLAFDIDKAVAAAAYLMKKHGGRASIFVLLKMMYAAEREALSNWHRPITGDSFASMRKGPVLSRTYDLIKGQVLATNSDMVKWSKHFSPRENNEIRLIADPDFDFLSERELKALDKADHEIGGLIKQHGAIADRLHEQWPEWKDPAKFGRGSIPLSLEEILCEILEDDFEVEKILGEIRAVNSAKAALQVSAA